MAGCGSQMSAAGWGAAVPAMTNMGMPNMSDMMAYAAYANQQRMVQEAMNTQAQLNMMVAQMHMMQAQPSAPTQVEEAVLPTPAAPAAVEAGAEDADADADADAKNAEVEERPCDHNDWDDVRTRKGFKVLRCRECQKKWKLLSSNVPRCMPFLHDCCEKGEDCPLLHVRRKKHTISERYEKFGDQVLEGVSVTIATMAATGTTSQMGSDDDATSQSGQSQSAQSSPPESDTLSIVNSTASQPLPAEAVMEPLPLSNAAPESLNPYMKVFLTSTPEESTVGWSQLAQMTQRLVDCPAWN